ncbi:MAG: hypothetical protein GEU98_09625 [Pseudonocardiaceae bacterium]|nr:hypothetical protein [Pseudonocardiaceae bacterium]
MNVGELRVNIKKYWLNIFGCCEPFTACSQADSQSYNRMPVAGEVRDQQSGASGTVAAGHDVWQDAKDARDPDHHMVPAARNGTPCWRR